VHTETPQAEEAADLSTKHTFAMTDLEICIDCTELSAALASASAADEGGAQRIECCASMNEGGLSPDLEIMSEVVDAVGGKVDIVVMIRPRPGDFNFTRSERLSMLTQAESFVALGVDGIAFGSITGGKVDEALCEEMILFARTNGVKTTFHRAFDALSDPLDSIALLQDLGIDRILTSGTPWGSSLTAIEGLPSIQDYIEESPGIEWVVGGGVGAANAPTILRAISGSKASLHAYSSVLENGRTSPAKVRELAALMR
jgi:copper homeostasis protein